MRELRTLGSVRGVLSNGCLYRDCFDDQPCPVRVVTAKAQASSYLGTEDFNAPAPRRTRERHCAVVRHRLGHDLASLLLYGVRLRSLTQVAMLLRQVI